MYTECNYVTENKNNACITVLDSGSGGGTNQITMGRTRHHILMVKNKKNRMTSIMSYKRLQNAKQEN